MNRVERTEVLGKLTLQEHPRFTRLATGNDAPFGLNPERPRRHMQVGSCFPEIEGFKALGGVQVFTILFLHHLSSSSAGTELDVSTV